MYPANTHLCRVRRKRREDHTSVSGSSWTTCAYHVRNATRRAPGWKREDVKVPATKLPTRMKSKCIKAGPSVISAYIRVRAQRARENPETRTFVYYIYFNPHTYMYLAPHSHPTTAPRNPELQISAQQIPQISAAIILSSELHRLMQTTAFCFKTRRVPVLPTSCPFALNGRLMTRVHTRFLIILH